MYWFQEDQDFEELQKIIKTITDVGTVVKKDLFFPKHDAPKNHQEAIFFFRFAENEDALKTISKDFKVTAFNRTLKVVQVRLGFRSW